MKFSQTILRVDASGVRKMFEMVKSLKNPIDVSLGSPLNPIPANVVKGAVNHIYHDAPGYTVTKGDEGVRRALADKLKTKNKIAATADNIIITPGATAGLCLALWTLLDASDEIIVIDPSFVLYKQQINFIGAKGVYISSYPHFRLPIDAIRDAVTSKTQAVLINTPNNPSGVVYTEEELRALAEIAQKHNVVIISDEVYEEYVYDEREHVSIGAFYPHTVTIMSPSKTASLAGWRVGYVVAPQDMIEQMIKVQQVFYVCAPVPAQHALKASLSVDYGPLRKQFVRKRDAIHKVLRSTPLLPYELEGAFYAFLHVGDEAGFMKKALEKELLLVPGSTFSEKETHVRLAYSVDDAVLQKALKILVEKGV